MIGRQKESQIANPRVVATKLCAVCGRLILWRRRSARTWDVLQFCSAVCRRNRDARERVAEQRAPVRPRNPQIRIASAC